MKHLGAAVACGLVLLLLAVLLLNWFDTGQAELRAEKTALAQAQARVLAPLWLAVKRVLLVAAAVIVTSAAAVAAVFAAVSILSAPNLVRLTWLRSWLIKPGRDTALYPALAEPDGRGHIRVLSPVNEAGAQKIAALTAPLKPDVRLQGSAARAALRPTDDQYMLPEPELTTRVNLEQVLAHNPETSPHWLCVGDTGSGKSTAIFAIARHIRRTLGAEFIVLEREAQNWNEQAAALTVAGYLDALEHIEVERQRRAGLLRAADVDHISKLAAPPPYLCVIIEEAESVYSAMALTGRAHSTRYKAIVRDLASMGRKQGIILIVATQTGTSEVFDVPTRKNLGHKLFFRNEPAVGDAWGIPREAGLARLPAGTAWSLNHAALVDFPNQPRPRLPLSKIYREARPQQALLPADALADGYGPDDQPDDPGVILVNPGTGTVPEPATPGHFAATPPPFSGTVPVLTVPEPPRRIERRCPTPVEAAAMRAHYQRTNSKTAVCMAFYGYKNGNCWEWVKMALRGEL